REPQRPGAAIGGPLVLPNAPEPFRETSGSPGAPCRGSTCHRGGRASHPYCRRSLQRLVQPGCLPSGAERRRGRGAILACGGWSAPALVQPTLDAGTTPAAGTSPGGSAG